MFCKYSRLHLYSEYRPALRVSHQFVALAIVCNVCNGVTRYLDTTWVASPPPISHLTLAPCLVRKPSNIKIPVWCHGLLLSCHQCHLELCMNITTHFHTHNMYTVQKTLFVSSFLMLYAKTEQYRVFLLFRFMLTFISHPQWVTYPSHDEGCS